MAHYGTLRDFAFEKDIDDVRGTALYGANHEKLGKIDDIIFDHRSGDIRYAVVDTGGWLHHHKFLVPADRIREYEKDRDAFEADLGKEQIEKFPRYDEKKLESEQDWRGYEDEYKRAWNDDPAQHRSDRFDLDVTPATVEAGISPTGVPAAREIESVPMGSLGEEVEPEVETAARRDLDSNEAKARREREDEDIAQRDLTPHRLAGKFPAVAEGSNKLHMTPEVAEDRDLDQMKVGSSRVPDVTWEDNATGSSGRGVSPDGGTGATSERFPLDAGERELKSELGREPAEERGEIHRVDVGTWHPRMKRFEEVLKKNRVDVTASCPSCAPAKDKAA